MAVFIDEGAILEKLIAWEKSPKGQATLNNKLNSYIIHNVERTEAGSRVLTRRKMIELADKLVRMLRDSASAAALPPSVMADFATIKRGRVTPKGDGSFEVEINFNADLSRPSLQPHSYGGVDNIIAIFNNGYPRDAGRAEAISHVMGEWHGKQVTALGSRPGLYFMQDAVNSFNSMYGAQYDIYAELDAVYDEE